jgi:hypothetical protein
MMRTKTLALVSLLTLIVWGVTPAHAQEVEILQTQEVSESASADVESKGEEVSVVSKPLLQDEIKTVEQTYKGQLETYRTAINRYQIAKQQYTQLQTLTSLEEAVRATREAMIARNDVLLTYLTLLRLNLIQATGINLTLKDPTITQLEATHAWLGQHQEKVTSAVDRAKLLEVADEFSTRQESITNIAYLTQSLLAVGKLQTVYDKTVLLAEEVETEVVQGKTDVKQGERQRALAEIEREISLVQQFFAAVNQDMEKENTQFSRSFYTKLQRDLGSAYSQLAQTLSHLSELVRL